MAQNLIEVKTPEGLNSSKHSHSEATEEWEEINFTTEKTPGRSNPRNLLQEKIFRLGTRDWSWKFYSALGVFLVIYTIVIALFTLNSKTGAFNSGGSTSTNLSSVNLTRVPATLTQKTPPLTLMPDTKILKVDTLESGQNLRALLVNYPNLESLTLDFKDFCPKQAGTGRLLLKSLIAIHIMNTRNCKRGLEGALGIRAPILQELHLDNVLLDKSLYQSKVTRFLLEPCKTNVESFSKVFISNSDICKECLFGHDTCPSISYRKFSSYNVL